MPFSLVTACATYVRLMRIVLDGLPNVSFYFDNIFVYSSEWSTHTSALKSVLDRLQNHGLALKPSKCRFGVESIDYMGFVLSPDLLQPQVDKVTAIVFMTPPSTKKLLWSFLGCEGNELQERKDDEGCADLSPLYQVNYSLLPVVAVKSETTGKTTSLYLAIPALNTSRNNTVS